ncbi:MAG: ABC transporter, permease protein 1 (cluster 1, maltose/g3p/polyamine/iron), partial [uncultured Thermomicrobiales bacterium]
ANLCRAAGVPGVADAATEPPGLLPQEGRPLALRAADPADQRRRRPGAGAQRGLLFDDQLERPGTGRMGWPRQLPAPRRRRSLPPRLHQQRRLAGDVPDHPGWDGARRRQPARSGQAGLALLPDGPLHPLCPAERHHRQPLAGAAQPRPGHPGGADRSRPARVRPRLPREPADGPPRDRLRRQLALVGLPDGALPGGDAEHPAGALRVGPARRRRPLAGVHGHHPARHPADPRLHDPDDDDLVVPDLRLHLDPDPGRSGRRVGGAGGAGVQGGVPQLQRRVCLGARADALLLRRDRHLGLRRPASPRLGDL